MLGLTTRLSESRLPTLTATVLKRLSVGLGIETVRDLLWHVPLRYEDRGAVVPIGQLTVPQRNGPLAQLDASGPPKSSGKGGGTVTIIGVLQGIRVVRTRQRRMSLAEGIVGDPTGTIHVVWFNQPWMAERLHVGDRLLLSGKITASSGRRYLANPLYEILERGKGNLESGIWNLAETQRGTGTKNSRALNSEFHIPHSSLIPIYSETEGITSRWLNYLANEALKRLGDLPDDVPQAVRKNENLMPLRTCLKKVHSPATRQDAERAKRELLFRELFVLQCAVLLSRAHRESQSAIAVPLDAELIKRFIASLPFRLTETQRVASYEILRDIEKPRPMHRLLVGDVGSGKTIVAAIAAANAVKTGRGQVALMAPTEILAKQHFATLGNILKPLKIRIALLTGSESRATPKRIASEQSIRIAKPKLFKEVAEGSIDLLIGTHTLISGTSRSRPSRLKPQGALRFKKLILAIIDEQHRFGVAQRKRMEDAEMALTGSTRVSPHLLTLTATPIPRTLALTIFGDLDLSTITELPEGRRPIETIVLKEREEHIAFTRIREEIARGHQAFIICPLVSRSEKIEAKAATEEFERLKGHVFPDLSLGLLHGQMKSDEKEHVMRAFAKGKIHVLVATPVVEVGIDIPNATVMVVEGAERFGLAQLYQFRGRVGRSNLPSFCYFIAGARGALTTKRLHAIRAAKSGRDIAKADLALRGPGEFLGVEQSGVPDTIMQAIGDLDLVQRARGAAKSFLETTPLMREHALARRIAELRALLHLS